MQGRILLILLLVVSSVQAQKSKPSYFVDANYFSGSIIRHNKDISHLIREHPDGLIVGLNYKTFGDKKWHQLYNYPDWGVSFAFQDSNYDILGRNFGFYAHYNFYFLKRNIMLRVAQGIAYATNPYHIDYNFKNNAYGSRFLSSTYLLLNYNKANLFKRVGLQAGIALVHYSNGNFRAPNSSTNTFSFNVGLQYDFTTGEKPAYNKDPLDTKVKERVRYNFVLRGGVNESDYIGLGQHPFLVVSGYASKKVSHMSTLQLGAEVFFSKFLQKEIEFVSTAFLNTDVRGDEDYKRVGIFAGHEFYFGKLGILGQFGYYVYYPYNFEGRTYIRAGGKYYFSEKLFGVATLKSHGAKVEAIEFGIGVSL